MNKSLLVRPNSCSLSPLSDSLERWRGAEQLVLSESEEGRVHGVEFPTGEGIELPTVVSHYLCYHSRLCCYQVTVLCLDFSCAFTLLKAHSMHLQGNGTRHRGKCVTGCWS